ncbi:MAG: RNA-binding transcriptional accessory protein [Candidatus Omnitrophica bacterium]|nr:RNA-binding transcriptional accessory protein [Candidatus Omnitrophota bacterium]
MNLSHVRKVAKELNIRPEQAESVVVLLDGGATIPFIARYRKEVTGTLDEVAVTAIRDRMKELKDLDDRRAVILESIEKQGKLTLELKQKIEAALTITSLEDLYLPFKPKRRTRGMIAKEKGLEPLAELIFRQDPSFDPGGEALKYVDPAKELKDVSAVLAGARDIIGEWINENAESRAKVRELYLAKGKFHSRVIKGKEEAAVKFKDYFDWQEEVATAPSHRVLAARRGEKEQFLLLRIVVAEAVALQLLKEHFLKKSSLPSPSALEVDMALEDAYRRLLAPSIENEVRLVTKEKADAEAIQTFIANLRQLLMAPPLGQLMVMGIDPGLRTGCKVVCLDQQGKLLTYQTIYLAQSEAREREAAEVVGALVKKYNIAVIAIGNGTASRETEAFINGLKLKDVKVMMVSESGASYYSASEVARREFPDLDVSVRGSVSIARRLQDPLAELVKLDPKNIGVGQYQHDVDQSKLKQSLDDVTMSCVNMVGVDLNTASAELLMYVSGVGPALAKNVVEFRNANGRFRKRDNILNVPRFSMKAYEQAAGFLRVIDGDNPLDASAVHPESYPVVERMARSLNCSLPELMADDRLRARIDLKQFVTEAIGLPTLKDILSELAKPGRDPRARFEFVHFKDGINCIEDLAKDMALTGVVTNVTDFGAFVDIGVHHDGLVHISELSDKYVKHPSDIVKLHQKVSVVVKDIDLVRKRIALTMKSR